MFVIDAMITLFPNMCDSKSAARRLIKQRAVKIDDMLVEDELAIVAPCRIVDTNYVIVALLEGSVREKLLRGEDINIEIDQTVEESHTKARIKVGKKNIGIIDLG